MNPLLSQINQNIKQHNLFTQKDFLILGFSGGPDSVFLLEVILKLKRKWNFKIALAHVNYGLRKDATHDEEFCKKTAQEKNIPLYLLKINAFERKKLLKSGMEERARKIRFAFFKNIQASLKKNKRKIKIVLAHQANDQAETIIFKFFRGSGISGLRGMKYLSQNIVRPLLNINKEDILNYLKQKKIKYCLDKTNFQKICVRNNIRLELIPWITKKINANFIKTINRNAVLFQELEDFFEDKITRFLDSKGKFFLNKNKKDCIKIYINKKAFLKQKKIIQSLILRKTVQIIIGNNLNKNYTLINSSINYLNNQEKKETFKGITGLTIKKRGDRIIFTRV